jgi:hypothetical protein
MKNKLKGFILIETLIVSVFVISTLVFLYAQFQKIEQGYEKTFIYNTTDNLYKVYNIRVFLLDGLNSTPSNYSNVLGAFLTSSDTYYNLTGCPAAQILLNKAYCDRLLDQLGVKTVIFTKDDLTDIKADLNNLYFISEDKKEFIKHLKISGTPGQYRLIVEFNDKTFGTLKIFEGM